MNFSINIFSAPLSGVILTVKDFLFFFSFSAEVTATMTSVIQRRIKCLPTNKCSYCKEALYQAIVFCSWLRNQFGISPIRILKSAMMKYSMRKETLLLSNSNMIMTHQSTPPQTWIPPVMPLHLYSEAPAVNYLFSKNVWKKSQRAILTTPPKGKRIANIPFYYLRNAI